MADPGINLTLMGNSSAGKAHLMKQIDENWKMGQGLNMPSSVDFVRYSYYNAEDGRRVNVKVWDSAGQERFSNVPQ